MNARTAFFVVSVLLFVVGCSSVDKHVVGAWVGKMGGSPITITLNADSSYTAEAPGETTHGRWSSHDTTVQLFHDVREAKSSSFGDSQSLDAKFSDVEGTLTLPNGTGTSIVLHRAKT